MKAIHNESPCMTFYCFSCLMYCNYYACISNSTNIQPIKWWYQTKEGEGSGTIYKRQKFFYMKFISRILDYNSMHDMIFNLYIHTRMLYCTKRKSRVSHLENSKEVTKFLDASQIPITIQWNDVHDNRFFNNWITRLCTQTSLPVLQPINPIKSKSIYSAPRRDCL